MVMKLGTLKTSSRDGKLVVVSKDLSRYASATVGTMQLLIENWDNHEKSLIEIYTKLNNEVEYGEKVDFNKFHSPLPRAYQWLDGSAYVTHVELVRKSRGVELPESFWSDPLMYQGASDSFIGPRDDIQWQNPKWGLDLEAELAVITGDVTMASSVDECGKNIKLLMMVNDVSLRGLIPSELKKGFGFINGKPATAFAPVAITPDELGNNWQDFKVNKNITSKINDVKLGSPLASQDMTFNFAQLVAHASKTRHLHAGTIIGSGTIANKNYKEVGSSCLLEKRMIEKIETGDFVTPFLKVNDQIEIDVKDSDGKSIFGAIKQKVVEYK